METNNVDFTFLIPYLTKISNNGYFYNPSNLLSRRKPFNCIQTSRSVGKSTIWACAAILNYIVKGKKFFYLRRTDDELIKAARDFFSNAVDILNQYYPELGVIDAYYEAGKFILQRKENEGEKEVFGRTLALSLVYKAKSLIFPDANLVIFDEFVAISQSDYLGNQKTGVCDEYDRLINLYSSIDREIGKAWKNETMVVCLGNSSSLFNPVFIGLGAVDYIKSDSHFICPKNKLFCIERLDKNGVGATKDIEQSFSFLLASEEEKQKMFQNDTQELGSRFVSKIPQKSKLRCNFVLGGKMYGIYYSEYKQLFWIGNGVEGQETYSLDIESHNKMTDAELCSALNNFFYADTMKRAYMQNRLFFNSVKTERDILSYLKLS